MELTRRSILAGAPVLGAAAALPAQALGAQGGGARELADALRARWARQSTAFLAGVLGQDPGEASAELRQIGAGVGALDVVKELELLDTRTQAQAPLQQLWREVLAATGRSARVSAAAVEAWLAPGGDADDPDGRHVRGMMGAMRIGLRGAETRPARKAQMDAALAGVLDDDRPGQLRAHARRLLRRARKAEVLSAHLAADPEAFARTFALDRQRASALGVPVQALADHAAAAPPRALTEGEDAGDVALGVIGTGVLILLGLVLGVVGFCVTACGGGAAGMALLILGAVLVILATSRAGDRRRRAAEVPEEAAEATPPPHTCPPCPECPPAEQLAPAGDPWAAPPPPADPAAPSADPAAPGADPAGAQGLLPAPAQPIGWLSVPADGGWVTAPPAAPRHDQVVLAWGLVQSGRAWPADADGDGVAAGPGAPLPGAPAGALVGRVGDRTFFLGAEGLVPRGLAGPLLLAINLSPAAAARATGGVEVQLLQRAWEVHDA